MFPLSPPALSPSVCMDRIYVKDCVSFPAKVVKSKTSASGLWVRFVRSIKRINIRWHIKTSVDASNNILRQYAMLSKTRSIFVISLFFSVVIKSFQLAHDLQAVFFDLLACQHGI